MPLKRFKEMEITGYEIEFVGDRWYIISQLKSHYESQESGSRDIIENGLCLEH
jgi:hypothetical protein